MHNGKHAIKTVIGNEIRPLISKVTSFRIKYFKDFPYLYQGNELYEQKYLSGFADDDKSILVTIENQHGDLKAISTALPLATSSTILDGAPQLFQVHGYNPKEVFYYGEVIFDYEIRGLGFLRQIYSQQDQFASKLGYRKIAIATVERENADPRAPAGYRGSDQIWQRLGFEKTKIRFEYEWPTITATGQVEDVMNPMVYWVKNLEKST